MTEVPAVLRSLLAEAFPNSPRLVRTFEELVQALIEAKDTAEAAASGDIASAEVLTLAPSAALPNGRALVLGDGFDSVDDGETLSVSLSDLAAKVDGGHPVTFVVTGPTSLVLPEIGTLVSTDAEQTMSNKTLAAPAFSGLGNFANDAAAAAGGVAIGGTYRNGSVLQVRVT